MGGKYNWEVVEGLAKALIKNEEIGKNELDAAKICIACVLFGYKKKQKIKQAAICENFDEIWANLKMGGYFTHRGQIESIEEDIPLMCMIAVAEGWLERKAIKRGEAAYKITKKGVEFVEGERNFNLKNLI